MLDIIISCIYWSFLLESGRIHVPGLSVGEQEIEFRMCGCQYTEVHDLLIYTSCSSWLTSMLIIIIQQAMDIGLDLGWLSHNHVEALNTTIIWCGCHKGEQYC